MADFLQSGPTRSQLVAQMLQQGRRQFPQQIQSVGEGVARTGSRLIDVMMQKKMMDEELERRGSQQAADQTALMAAIGGTPEWQNPDFDPAATGGAQPITSIIPGQDGQVLGMGANPQQQTLIDAVAGGTPQAALSAMGTQGISPEMVRNLGSMGMQAQMAERQTQAARQAALDAESADRRRFIFEQGLKTDDKRELARFEANLERSEERRVGKECRSRWAPEH